LEVKMEYNKKEELFDKITGLKYMRQGVPKNWYNKGVDDSFRYIKNFFDKEFVPEVPQYVADWYEDNKGNLDYNIWNYIMDWEDTEEDSFKRWVNSSKDAFQTIINMHQFGYEIKEEKKYLVKLIQGGQYLHTDHSGETYFTAFSQSSYTKDKLEELDLEWVFDCPGIELEEVQ
jgi:hypothetical protein